MIWGRMWPVTLSLVMLDQSNLPPEWSYCTIWESHQQHEPFQLHNIRMIESHSKPGCSTKNFKMTGWPVFGGKRIVVKCYEWFSFSGPGSGQYMPNTPVTCHHKFQSDRCIWEPTLHCIAFRLSLLSLSHGCVFCNFLTLLPLMTPASPNRPNTKPLPLQSRFCSDSNSGLSERSSVSRPRPTPGRRHMTYSILQ